MMLPDQFDASAIPRVTAPQTPVVGKVVISKAGDIAPCFKKVETCNAWGCGVIFYNNRAGIGREVIRIEIFF